MRYLIIYLCLLSPAYALDLSGYDGKPVKVGQEVEIITDLVFPGDMKQKGGAFCYPDDTGSLEKNLRAEFGSDKAALVLEFEASQPGKYIVHCWTVRNGGEEAFVEITVGGGIDPPDPPDPPIPPGERRIVVIEETSERTHQQAAILLNPTMRKWLADQGHSFWVLDQDQVNSTGHVPKEFVPYFRAAEGKKLPLLLIGTLDNVLYSGPLPGSVEDLYEKVGEYD